MRVWHDVDLRLAERADTEFTIEDRKILTACNIYECGDYIHGKYGLGGCGADVVEMINSDMMEFYKRDATLRPGVEEFVSGLFELGVPMSVASSTVAPLLRQGMKTTGLDQYFRAIVSVDDVGSSKREPAVYDLARRPLGTTREQTWGFEDALYAVRTLNDSGYKTCGVFDSDVAGSETELKNEADLFITEFTDITPKDFLQYVRESQMALR